MPRSPRLPRAVRRRQGRGRRRRCLDGSADARRWPTALPDVDILINNAGIFEPKGFFDIPDEDWSRFFEVNVMSGVRLSRAYMPGMLKRNWGRIVFISSESALNIPKEMIHYGMTKTAQLSVSRGPCRDDPRHRGDGQFGAAGPDHVGRRRDLRQTISRSRTASRWRRRRRSSSSSTARRHR